MTSDQTRSIITSALGAALVPLTKSGHAFWEVNVNGSRIVAEEAVRAGVKSFLHVSSSAVYGRPVKCPVRPDTPELPVEIYGRGKLAGEHAVRGRGEANSPGDGAATDSRGRRPAVQHRRSTCTVSLHAQVWCAT